MGVSTDTYILIGCKVDDDWGSLPTDGQGDQDAYDDWHDRHGELVIYQPKPGDLVYFDNIDGKNPYIGRVVKMDKGKWSDGTEFFETFDVARLTREIEEVTVLLKEKLGLELPVALHIVSNVV
jgi:hypothetical protein